MVVVTHAELGDVDLHRVYDGEAAVPLLLRHHHSVTALWWLGNDIAGWTKTNTDIRSRVSTDDWQSDQTYTSNSERIGSVVTIILGMDVNQYLRSCWTLCHVEQHCWVVLTKLDHTTPLQKCYKDKVTVTLIFFFPVLNLLTEWVYLPLDRQREAAARIVNAEEDHGHILRWAHASFRCSWVAVIHVTLMHWQWMVLEAGELLPFQHPAIKHLDGTSVDTG